MNKIFVKALSVGVYPAMGEGRKFALQVAALDAYWSLLVFIFYIIHTYHTHQIELLKMHTFLACSMVVGILLIWKRYSNLGRVYIHQAGLIGIFLCVDAFGTDSGFEYYYFASILVPHVTFSLDEFWKGALLSASACILLITQQVIGTGLFMSQVEAPSEERFIAIVFNVFFTLTVLLVARWRLREVRKEIDVQQKSLVHSSNMIVLGEMASSIAHEINNPLQSLNLQVTVLRDVVPLEKQKHLDRMNNTILRIARMVQGLSDLSCHASPTPNEKFVFNKILEDVLVIFADRIKSLGISLYIEGESSLDIGVSGQAVQISQVLVNLLNNSIEALSSLEERWIRIELKKTEKFLQISVIDSGSGINEEIASQMLKPFFTSKSASSGAGLGLSVSASILERNFGSLHYDTSAPNTKFIVLLPLA